MIELLIFLAFIYILESVLKIFISDYDKCYSEMEDTGTAAFNCCCGLTGGTRHTDYLQENCVDCPYLVLSDKKGEKSSVDILSIIIKTLNFNRKKFLETKDKKYWWNMIQLLPSSYNQTRNVMLNYEVLANIYRQRKGHKLDEWREFCKWIESLPYSELIIGKEDSDNE